MINRSLRKPKPGLSCTTTTDYRWYKVYDLGDGIYRVNSGVVTTHARYNRYTFRHMEGTWDECRKWYKEMERMGAAHAVHN